MTPEEEKRAIRQAMRKSIVHAEDGDRLFVPTEVIRISPLSSYVRGYVTDVGAFSKCPKCGRLNVQNATCVCGEPT